MTTPRRAVIRPEPTPEVAAVRKSEKQLQLARLTYKRDQTAEKVARWESRLKRAKNKLRKYNRTLKYYEKKIKEVSK